MDDEPTVQQAIRIPQSWADRVQALVARLAKDHIEVKPAGIMRSAMGLGLEALERKYGLAPPAKPAAQKGGGKPARKPKTK
jgi:hypothetical protein